MSPDEANELNSNGERDSAEGFWRLAWRRFRRNRLAIVAAGYVAVVILACFALPLVLPHTYSEQNLAATYAAPALVHPLGTDNLGRDMLARVLVGGRISLLVGIVGAGISLIIGVTYGGVSGYIGGRLDMGMMRVVDVLYGLPYMFVVILLVSVFGRSLILLFVALGAVQWLTLARVVRGQVLEVKEREFVEGARALGVRWHLVLWRHVLPNVVGTVVIYATLTVPSVMLQEAFLSFLGLGVQPPMASWGSLSADAMAAINPVRIYWWLVVFPGLALGSTLLALNFLGDGLRDALDPRLANG